MENKAREEVRPTTRIGSRILGVILLLLYVLEPALDFINIEGPWYYRAGIGAIGLLLAFPGLPVTHAIIGRLDKMLPGGG